MLWRRCSCKAAAKQTKTRKRRSRLGSGLEPAGIGVAEAPHLDIFAEDSRRSPLPALEVRCSELLVRKGVFIAGSVVSII